jgi:hypothetical protein
MAFFSGKEKIANLVQSENQIGHSWNSISKKILVPPSTIREYVSHDMNSNSQKTRLEKEEDIKL